MVWPLGGIDLCPEGDSMPHRVIAAAAATSALLIGTALPAAATEPTHTTHTPTEPPTDTERPTCDEFGLKTLLESAADGGSNENEIAVGIVHSGETAGNPEGSFLDLFVRPELFGVYEIKLVALTGESGKVAIYDEPTFEGDQWVSLHVGDVGQLEVIKHWVACGKKIRPTPTPTDTEPTTEPSPTETKPTTKPIHTGSPKAVPTNIPAGSGTSTGDTPWALFGVAAASATAAAATGTVIGRRRNANRV
jgi:hypothetical protein